METKATATELAPFAQRVEREAVRRGFDRARRQVVVGDGAPWIWNLCAELPSVLCRLTRESLERRERNQPGLAASFHRYIVLILSERLIPTKSTLKAVLA